MKYSLTRFIIKANNDEIRQIARELLTASVAECGYESFLETEEGVDGYIQREFYDEKNVVMLIDEFLMPDVVISFSTEDIIDQDWNETWEKEEGFSPVSIDDKILVFDALHDCKESFSDDMIKIGIRARNAFGTGTHETTRMMLSTIASIGLADKSVLDCGCGTGILGIAALRCGAHSVVAYDIDEWSSDNTLYNAEQNGVGQYMKVLHGDVSVIASIGTNVSFDVVLANINRNILLNDMPSFNNVMHHGSLLIISGFYDSDVQLLEKMANELGMVKKNHRCDGDWHCVVFEKY